MKRKCKNRFFKKKIYIKLTSVHVSHPKSGIKSIITFIRWNYLCKDSKFY